MLKRLVACGFCTAALLAAAAPAQAGWIHGRPVFGHPCPVSYLPLGFLTGGSHLGLGPGYPGLHPPYAVLRPYGYAPVLPPQAPAVLVIPVPIPDKSGHRGSQESRAAPQAPEFDYRETVERVRKLYPRGIPGIEPLPGQSPK